LAWQEVHGALDHELARLPESLRYPLILCYLQAQTRDEAATALGISLAKLKRRLERARNLLRDRLTRLGFTLPAAGLGAVLSERTWATDVIGQTARTATAYAKSGAAQNR
jgi:hypothetical protein